MSLYDISSLYPGVTAFADAQVNSKSDQVLVPGVSGQKIVVDVLVVSMSAAGSFFMKSATTGVIFPTMNLAANSTLVIYDPKIKTNAGESLNWTDSITGNFSIYVRCHLEG
jgi:hypothetical protein